MYRASAHARVAGSASRAEPAAIVPFRPVGYRWGILLALGALGATSAEAQDLAPRGAAGSDILTLNLYGGGYSPASSLSSGVDFRNSGTVGGSATVWVHPLIGVRANVLYARTEISAGAPEPLEGENPNIWSYSGDAVLRLPFAAANGRDTWFPYLVGGLGAKTYSVMEANFSPFWGLAIVGGWALLGVAAPLLTGVDPLKGTTLSENSYPTAEQYDALERRGRDQIAPVRTEMHSG